MRTDRLCLLVSAWPEGDRACWMAALAPGSARRFSIGPRAPDMPAGTRRKVQGGYSRWLGFLATSGLLDTGAAPPARVTEEAVAAWLDDMRGRGNADHTIVGRLDELRRAMAVLAPGQDFGWLTRPGGVPIRAGCRCVAARSRCTTPGRCSTGGWNWSSRPRV